jgi:hypothetical protein
VVLRKEASVNQGGRPERCNPCAIDDDQLLYPVGLG